MIGYFLFHSFLLLAFSSLVSSNNAVWMGEGTYASRQSQVCVDIPRNFSLCSNLEYQIMRLPNLFGHETLDEIFQQAAGWIPLFQLGCHPKTKLFLCSLFTPVCLEQAIPPCRSLCEAVKSGCEPHMLKHGFPWPRIVDCAQYPQDNDMCIKVTHQQSPSTPSATRGRPANRPYSNQAQTNSEGSQLYETILNRFCMSNWTMRTKGNLYWNNSDAYLQITAHQLIYGSLPQRIAGSANESEITLSQPIRFKPLRVPYTLVPEAAAGQKGSATGRKYLIIGQTLSDHRLKAILVVPFNTKIKQFRKAIKEIKEDDVDCDADEIQDFVANFYSEQLKIRPINSEMQENKPVAVSENPAV